VDTGPICAGTYRDSYTAHPDGWVDDGASVNYSSAFCGPYAAQDDGHRNAALYALHAVERARRIAGLLAGWQPRWIWATGLDKSDDEIGR